MNFSEPTCELHSLVQREGGVIMLYCTITGQVNPTTDFGGR
jgi:hypothetical protein